MSTAHLRQDSIKLIQNKFHGSTYTVDRLFFCVSCTEHMFCENITQFNFYKSFKKIFFSKNVHS